MSVTRRRNRSVNYNLPIRLIIILILIYFFIHLVLWSSCFLASLVAKDNNVGIPITERIPISFGFDLIQGTYKWPIAATMFLIIQLVISVGGISLLLIKYNKNKIKVKNEHDIASEHILSINKTDSISEHGAYMSAKRLNVYTDVPGLYIGRTVKDRQNIYGTWEDEQIDIWGPRTGKTTSRAIPNLIDAPGAALATSNKRDLLDSTRLARSLHGKIWVFDPQSVANEAATWFWNPLSYIKGVDQAVRLSAVLSQSTKEKDAKQDAYFDPAGENLLASLMLAASVEKAPMSVVYQWASDSNDTTPVNILRNAGYNLSADSVQGIINTPGEQRQGVYGVARKTIDWLTDKNIGKWIMRDGKYDTRNHFSTYDYARSCDTVYLLSYERQGSNAAPLVTAFTMALIEAVEEFALKSPGGRVPVPMVGILDEAANVCKWKSLPDLYSHFGSRGIVLITILQSWAQGLEVWGQNGIKKLWSAANIRVYGGGVSEGDFLGELEKMVGDYEDYSRAFTRQLGRGRGSGISYNMTDRVEKLFDVSDLASFPRGRALVIPSGMRPIMIETGPWWKNPRYENVVKKSLSMYNEHSEMLNLFNDKLDLYHSEHVKV